MMTEMTLRNMRFFAFHGVLPHEKKVGGEYRVTLHLKVDFSRACDTDRLEDTLNYAALYDLVKREMDVPSQLIEHVAGRILSKIGDCYPETEFLSVTVAKLDPPVGGAMEAAEVTLTKG